MKNKDTLLKAINNFDNFTKSQKSILEILVNFMDNNNSANISINSISKMSGFSKTIIYKNLNALEKGNYIERSKIPSKKIGLIQIKIDSFSPVLDFYEKKQTYISKKFT